MMFTEHPPWAEPLGPPAIEGEICPVTLGVCELIEGLECACMKGK